MRADGARMKLAAQDRAHRGPARVLLLERNAELREVLLWSFVEDGFVVVPCASLAELHRARRPGARDVAVVDCWSGPRPLPTDRERRDFARLGGAVPLVLLPNQRWADRLTAGDLGVSALLPKPFDLDTLLGMVAHLAGRASAGDLGDGRHGAAAVQRQALHAAPALLASD